MKKITLPRALTFPLTLLPARAHSQLLVLGLNTALRPMIDQGALDFLMGRVLCIQVRDLGIRYALTLNGSRLAPARDGAQADLTIAGDVHEFLMLALRKEDPDTLFFQRRLSLEGDTEMGLYVKNFLDGLDLDSLSLPAPVQHAMQRATHLAQRFI